ncbi:MAG: hypothetical protein ACI9SY_000060 [Candidatus Paceibacteria bacterium]|jgi:hypothetical protein
MLFEKIQMEPGEEILVMVRKHWFVIMAELFGIFVLIMLPFVALVAYLIFQQTFATMGVDLYQFANLIGFGVAGWLLLSLMGGFTIWTHYYLDLWIVTDRRIILVDQIHFFSRNVSVFRLERMQDIEFKVKGIIPTLLNFGTLKAQTAGAHESNFNSTGLPDPRGLQATIQKAMDARMTKLHVTPDEFAH